MASSVKKAIRSLFEDAAKSNSAMKRLLNPTVEGAGTRVFPARTPKNDQRYGIRIDKGESVKGKTDSVRLKLQINSNAESKTLRELAKKNPHRVVSTVDIDTSQDVTEGNLKKVEDELLNNLDI